MLQAFEKNLRKINDQRFRDIAIDYKKDDN